MTDKGGEMRDKGGGLRGERGEMREEICGVGVRDEGEGVWEEM